MFSWKKQNPPSKQRAAAQDTEDYSNLIAQGLKLANEDIGENDEYMDEDGDLGDLDDMDLDDPDLLAELHGLTGEAPPKPKTALAPAPAPAPAPATARTPLPVAAPPQQAPQAPQVNPKPSTPTPAPSTTKAAPPPNKESASQNPALAGLGLDLDGIMDDGDDDEEVELTEDDWKDPHFLSQLQSLGGKSEAKSQVVPQNPLAQTESPTSETEAPIAASSTSQGQQPTSPTTSNSAFTRKPSSTTSSMIAIPPRDNPYGDDQDDRDSITTTRTDEKSSPTRTKAAKHLEDIPKINHVDLLSLLKTRDTQYKKAALEAKRAGDTALAVERIKIFKSLERYIRLVEEGGFLDLELYPVPDAPLSTTPAPPKLPAEPSSAARSLPKTGNEAKPTTPRGPTIAPCPVEPTTQVSNSIAEASGEDMRSGMRVRGAVNGGIEFRQLAADDDFQIVSNSDADTYDMLESQLESQIKICTSTSGHYYQRGDKQTALEFHKLNKIFKTDLVSLQSYRKHGKKPPAFHFQDVRFEIEIGFYQEIGLNELSLNIIRAWDLSHKDVQASDIEAYVSWDLGWPTESMSGAGAGKGDTPTVKKTSKPDFGFKKILNIERTRAFQRFVERRKATFEVWHYRGIFRTSYLLGKAQVPLQPLLDHSEIHEVFPIVDPNSRRSTGGKIELKITLQRPLLKPEIAVKEEKWLVIDEFNSGGLGFPSPITTSTPQPRNASIIGSPSVKTTGVVTGKSARTPPPSQSPAPKVLSPAPTVPSPAAPLVPESSKVRTSVSPTPQVPTPRPNLPPAAKPALVVAAPETESSEKDKALEELNSVELLTSNMVLEAEIQAAQEQIHNANAVGNSEAADDYQDRLTQLEIKMKLLMLQVQTGQLTMEGYCKAVNARVDKDKQLAIQLNRLGLRTEAAKAMKRYKIMAAEMKEVEEAMAAQGDEDEEEE
ncbi:Coiled-coil and C2 domain-containing protein 1B [Podila epicladia]|nr:Coiled-coil and C2 domain-containing protein 1B [Podila epicladia]KAG0088732.1 Coiled-coil and C2 domain-containing protein 1B [Podila epicladia]